MASKLTGVHYGDGSNLTGVNASTLNGQPGSYYQKKTIVQTSAPAGSTGDLWWDDTDGLLNVYYNGAWVEASPSPSAPEIPDNAAFTTVRISSTTDASVTSTGHGFQVGNTAGSNIIIDTNEVMARNNGAVNGLHLNADGGDVTINNNLASKITFNSGSITATGDVTAYSDERLKTNVEVITDALDKIKQVRGVTFERKADGSKATGVIAQELAAVLPEAVKTDDEGMLNVAYGNVVGLLIEGMKEMSEQMASMQAEIEKLRGE